MANRQGVAGTPVRGIHTAALWRPGGNGLRYWLGQLLARPELRDE